MGIPNDHKLVIPTIQQLGIPTYTQIIGGIPMNQQLCIPTNQQLGIPTNQQLGIITIKHLSIPTNSWVYPSTNKPTSQQLMYQAHQPAAYVPNPPASSCIKTSSPSNDHAVEISNNQRQLIVLTSSK
jgi:hypothetical protein